MTYMSKVSYNLKVTGLYGPLQSDSKGKVGHTFGQRERGNQKAKITIKRKA